MSSQAAAVATARRTGRVKFFIGDKGYGFIKPDDGSPDVFLSGQRWPIPDKSPRPDERCSYVVSNGKRGIYADQIEVI